MRRLKDATLTLPVAAFCSLLKQPNADIWSVVLFKNGDAQAPVQ